MTLPAKLNFRQNGIFRAPGSAQRLDSLLCPIPEKVARVAVGFLKNEEKQFFRMLNFGIRAAALYNKKAVHRIPKE
jgi:hypothetical protein